MALSVQCAICHEHVNTALFADHFVNNQCVRGNRDSANGSGSTTPNHGKSSDERLLHSSTTGVILGATSTMPIHEGDMVLESAQLKKQFEVQDRELSNGISADQNPSGGLQVHDHLKSASMLKGQFYEDLMDEVSGYCGAFEDGQRTAVPDEDKNVSDNNSKYN